MKRRKPRQNPAMRAAAALAAFALAGCAAGGTGAARAPRPCPDTVRVAETRLVSAQEADKLTLGEAVDRMSQALLRAPGETSRAIEIRESRTNLSILVEDAEWVLALSAALDGPLASKDKARLRVLHERYAAQAPHADIAAQVSALLEDVRDEGLRRELKKLANRSWERERRRGARATQAAASAAPEAPVTPPYPPSPPSPDSASVPETAATSPERYCADQRAEAAGLFAEARSASDPAARERLLRQSLAALDACISRFPDAAEAAKARQNRERVSGELAR